MKLTAIMLAWQIHPTVSLIWIAGCVAYEVLTGGLRIV